MRVGLIGFGAIGQPVAAGIARGVAGEVELVGVLTRRNRAQVPQTRMMTDFAEFLASEPEIVVEAASAAAVADYAESILTGGASLILASSAALADQSLRTNLESVCERSGARIIIPAGALVGIDALSAAAVSELSEVHLSVSEPKPDRGESRVVFQGAAVDAARNFPTRLNVAMTAALAAQSEVGVTLRESPWTEAHSLELRARGAFGEFFARMQPNPAANRLSHIVALSQLATLRRLQQPIQVG